jgi:hypothetical protein
MSAGAAFSGSVAVVCLWASLASGAIGALAGFLAAAIAVVALAHASRRGVDEARLRLCPLRGVVLGEDGDGETPTWPVGVTPNLICLAHGVGSSRPSWSIWRDSLPPDGFRRIAAYALWRRNVAPNLSQHSELIARKVVTEQPPNPRTGRPVGR